MKPNDYIRCPHCTNIVGERTKDGGVAIKHGKRSYTVASIKSCQCERCGQTFTPDTRQSPSAAPVAGKAQRVGYIDAPPGFNATLQVLMGNQRIKTERVLAG